MKVKGKKMSIKTGSGHTCHIMFSLIENDNKEVVVYIVQRFFVPKKEVGSIAADTLRTGREVALLERRVAFRLTTFKALYQAVMEEAIAFFFEKRGGKQLEVNLKIEFEPKEVSNDTNHAKTG